MTKQEIKNYIKEKKLFKNPIVSKLGQGTNYDVFLIKDAKEKFVFRVNRENVATENKLENEFYILKFFAKEKIDFVQKPIFYDKQKKLSILTFAEGKEVSVSELNKKQLKTFILQLIKLHSLKYNDYKNFFKKHNIKTVSLKTPWQNLKKYGIDRFRFIEKNCDDNYVLNWIKPKLATNIKHTKETSYDLSQTILNHNDLAGSNIIVNKDQVSFIDWEHSSFVYNTGTGIGIRHILNYDPKSGPKKIKEIITLYNKYSNKKIKITQNKIDTNTQINKINDIIWSAMIFTEKKLNHKTDWNKYKKLTYQRIQEYENMFGQ